MTESDEFFDKWMETYIPKTPGYASEIVYPDSKLKKSIVYWRFICC